MKLFISEFVSLLIIFPIKEESKPPDKNKPTSTSLTFLYSTDSNSNSSTLDIASVSEIEWSTSKENGSQYLFLVIFLSLLTNKYWPGSNFEIFLLPVLKVGTARCLKYEI